MPIPQLLLPQIAPHSTTCFSLIPFASADSSSSMHITTFCTLAWVCYAGPHATTPCGVMVDPEECFRVSYTAYAAPTSAAPLSFAAISDALLDRVGDLDRALCQVQGQDRQSYQFRDLRYFPEATLSMNFRIL